MYDKSMEKLIYQKFILGTGEALFNSIDKGLGGVIFFTRDIDSKDQFINLISEIKQKANRKIFLSIDQEGGRVERTQNIHAKYLSPKFAYERGEEFLKIQTTKIAKELKEYGLNLNFAPCIDVNTNPNNPIIGERAFSTNTNDVIKAEKIVCDIFSKYGIIPCVKHFPGHGDANKDSHLDLPEINLSFNEMEKTHIAPFKAAIDFGVRMIMVAHLHCTCFDKEKIPTSLSKNAINYLRKILKYDEVIITDDMVMKGVQAYGSVEACLMAIEAGVDMFIFRDADFSTISIIDELVKVCSNNRELEKKILESSARINRLFNLI